MGVQEEGMGVEEEFVQDKSLYDPLIYHFASWASSLVVLALVFDSFQNLFWKFIQLQHNLLSYTSKNRSKRRHSHV